MMPLHPHVNQKSNYDDFCLNEPGHSKRNQLACVPIKDSDQTVQMHSLIRVLDVQCMCSQGFNVSSGENLGSDHTVGMCRLI